MIEPAQLTIPSVDQVTTVIQEILRTELGVEASTPDQSLMADLALDSISLMTLIVALEDRFEVIFKEEEAPVIQTIRELAQHLVHLKEKAC